MWDWFSFPLILVSGTAKDSRRANCPDSATPALGSALGQSGLCFIRPCLAALPGGGRSGFAGGARHGLSGSEFHCLTPSATGLLRQFGVWGPRGRSASGGRANRRLRGGVTPVHGSRGLGGWRFGCLDFGAFFFAAAGYCRGGRRLVGHKRVGGPGPHSS